MTLPSLADGSSPDGSSDPEELLYQFDQAWQKGSPPTLEAFVQALPAGNSQARRHLIEELLKIDLECRWRLSRRVPHKGKAANVPPRLENYTQRFPELGRPSLELIGEEYRVRQRWGDRPGHSEYLARFSHHGAHLKEALRQIDAQLATDEKHRSVAGPRLADLGGPPARPAGPAEQPRLNKASHGMSVAALLDTLRRTRLLSSAQLDELSRGAAAKATDPRSLAAQLVQRDWLTPYQANQLLQGRGADLVLGPHVILERLGEGGTGQVFKARHQLMERVVALKVIRRDLLTDDEVIQRFQREVQLISQLEHPNVVRAYDAGPAGATFCLAMEYVEGIDLGRLVRQQGPLPLAQACDFIRQAALGLQHIHERGLVHRDIKPPNLIVTSSVKAAAPKAVPVAVLVSGRDDAAALACTPTHPWGIVKILDLGLARLPKQVPGVQTNLLTPTRAMMMGTPDYLAPEQACNFHSADVRADIYSLGCTFFYLLTGQPPFPGGTLAEKLLRHQSADLPPLTLFRGDLPPQLSPVLQRMLAKRPADRFANPAEVAGALANLERDQLGAGGPGSGVVAVPAALPLRRGRLGGMATWLRQLPARRRWQLMIGVLAAVFFAGILLYSSKPLPLGWTVLDPQEYRAASGATLTKLPERSLLASGTLGTTDSYTVVARTNRVGITAIRLELLTHPSLPSLGPGRHSSGNPVLSEFRLLAAPRHDPSAVKSVVLVNPTADFNQQSWDVPKAIDGNPETGWAILPEAGKPHWAVFETQEAIGFRGGTILTFVFDQNYPAAPLGCFRLSVTTVPRPVRADSKLSELDN
jgi:serine/threonine-protein kinase